MIDILLTGCLLTLLCSFTIRSLVKTIDQIRNYRKCSFEDKKQRFKL